MTQLGRTLALYGMTGSGKTTQLGELAKWIKSRFNKRTIIHSIDPGGYDSIEHLVSPDLITIDTPGDENPWLWAQRIVREDPPEDVGMEAFDSATGIGDALLNDAADLASRGVQVGSEKVYNLKIPGTSLVVGANNKSQYGLIQNFMLSQLGHASHKARRCGVDVVWTFGEHYPEVGEASLIGPKLVGKALTSALPRHIRYTLRMVQVPTDGGAARHLLITQSMLEPDGLTRSLVNARFPLGSSVELPPIIEPASVPQFWDLVEQAKEEALIT